VTRLFVAVLPPDRLRRALAARLEISGRGDGVRWVPPERWHVTLCFVGEVADPDPVAAALVEAVTASSHRWARGVRAVLGPATTWLGGSGALVVPVSGLDALAGVVSAGLAPWVADPDRPFIGHLTIARAHRSRPSARAGVRRRAVVGGGGDPGPDEPLAGRRVSGSFEVGAVVLVASTVGRGPVVHRPVLEVSLART
jgi:2'-5' RNA ligase